MQKVQSCSGRAVGWGGSLGCLRSAAVCCPPLAGGKF